MIAFSLLWLDSVHAQLPALLLPLEGAHRFCPGDEPAWALPEHDDRAWQLLPVPGAWSAQGISSDVLSGWYRIHFVPPESLRALAPAVALGVIAGADEVFLNGARIGGEGRIGPDFVNPPWLTRVYRLPANLLRHGQGNVLAVRVMRFAEDGGIVQGPIGVGDYHALRDELRGSDGRVQFAEACLLTFYAVSFVLCAFPLLCGAREREYLALWLILTLYGLSFLLDTRLFYELGLRTPLAERLYYAVAGILPVPSLAFYVYVYQHRWNLFLKLLAFAFVPITIALLVLPAPHALVPVANLWMVLVAVLTGLIVYWALQAVWRRRPEALPLLIGVVGNTAAHCLEYVPELGLQRFEGILLSYWGMIFFLVCAMFALTARFQRLRQRLRVTTAGVLNAHEDERKRLARELHDGVVQSLLAVKLSLEMIRARQQRGNPPTETRLNELVKETTAAIDELRRVALDLRPAALEQRDLAEAVRWHAAKIEDSSGVAVAVTADDTKSVPSRLQDHLYRIFQEALKNALTHAVATHIAVTLTLRGRWLLLEVRDNGKGLEPRQRRTDTGGLGLSLIRERAELLGGSCTLSSSARQGTLVRVEVPLP